MLHRLILKPHPGVSDSTFRNTIDGQGGTVVDTIDPIGLYVAEFNIPETKGTLIASLRSHRHFKFAEEDMPVQPSLIPDDPQYSSQTNLTQINAAAAWEISTGSGVTIAILDTGVDGTHEDLSPNMVTGYNFWDSNTTTTDVQNHGTWVAGVAAASLNNTLGTSGVAGDANIMPLRISDSTGLGYWSLIAKAIVYAADHGCRVANCSYEQISMSDGIRSAAAYMQQQGGLFCVPSGNTAAEDTTSPTTDLINVSSINSDNAFSNFSTYGNIVQVCAPGNGVLTTQRGGGYVSVYGTSFSSPTVAGVLALMFSANPDLTPAQAMNILNTTATDLGSAGRDKYFGYGKVNAGAAVAAAAALEPPSDVADTTAPTVSISSPSAGTVITGGSTVTVNASDNIGVTHVDLYVNGVLYVSDTLAPWTFNWDTTAGTDGTKSLTAKAYDAAGNVTTSSAVSVTVLNASDTTAPTITISSPANGATIGNKNVSIKATASDANGISALSIAIDGVVKSTSSNSTAVSYMWNARKSTAGSHVILVTATDPSGNVQTKSITVTKS